MTRFSFRRFAAVIFIIILGSGIVASLLFASRHRPPRASLGTLAAKSAAAVVRLNEPYAILPQSFARIELEKVADVKLNDNEAFFLSILLLNETLWASYRTSLSSWSTNVLQLDENFAPIQDTLLTIPEVEDARVFEIGGEGWLIDNHFLKNRVVVSIDGKRKVQIDESSIPNFNRGKNWSPFVYRSQLYFVYSLKPLKIIKCEMASGKLSWAYEEHADAVAIDLNSMTTRGGTNAVVQDDFVYGIGRETTYESISCGGKTHSNVAQHYPLLWRFPVSVLLNSPLNDRVKRRGIQIRELNHPFEKGVNDPASLFVYNSSLFLTVSTCSCACLPEFRYGSNVQHNSVYKLRLSDNR